jgi:hypothetical protein
MAPTAPLPWITTLRDISTMNCRPCTVLAGSNFRNAAHEQRLAA